MALQFPEYLQTKTYTALRDRLALQHGGAIQAGVWNSGDFKVVQRAAGANMSVDVGGPGYALVNANNAGNKGLYHVENDATVNVTIPAAHATLPRIDQIVLDVSDSTNGGDAGDTPAFTVLGGTATSGATLTNRTGAAALPSNTLRLADILVGAAVTTITNVNIQDRRTWARGVSYQSTSAAQSIGGAGLPTPLTVSLEFTGSAGVWVTLATYVANTNGAADILQAQLLIDGSVAHDHKVHIPASMSMPVAFHAPLGVVTIGRHTLQWTIARTGGAGTYTTDTIKVAVTEDVRAITPGQ